MLELCVVRCRELRESDLRAERQHHVSQHGKNGSQAQHIGACEQAREKQDVIFGSACGNGLLVSCLVVSTALSRLGSAHASTVGEDARSVSEKEKVALEALPPLVLEDHTTKISQPMCIKDYPKKNLEIGKEVHRRSLHENFST